jgi:hypothetical protein
LPALQSFTNWVLSAPDKLLPVACLLQAAAVGFAVAGLTEVVGEALVGALAVVWAKAAVVVKRAVRARAEKSFMGVLVLTGKGCMDAARITLSVGPWRAT